MFFAVSVQIRQCPVNKMNTRIDLKTILDRFAALCMKTLQPLCVYEISFYSNWYLEYYPYFLTRIVTNRLIFERNVIYYDVLINES